MESRYQDEGLLEEKILEGMDDSEKWVSHIESLLKKIQIMAKRCLGKLE